MEEIVKNLAQFGVGGVLAGVMFWFYRQDRERSERQFTELGLNFRTIVEKNTEAIAGLKSALENRSDDAGMRAEFEALKEKVHRDLSNAAFSIARRA